MLGGEATQKYQQSRFQRHVSTLVWKCYLQRQRRWRLLLVETIFAFLLFMASVFIAKPVFLTPLEAQPEAPLAAADLLASLTSKNLLGYAPNTAPYDAIMARAAELLQNLQIEMLSAKSKEELNDLLFNRSRGVPLDYPVMWVLFTPEEGNVWKFTIRSTERAKYETVWTSSSHPNPHLRAGFLGLQVAVSQAILEHVSPVPPRYELSLVSMPVSPLMQAAHVRRAISGILLCLTLALISPVIETQALVVHETATKFKRALRMRNVDFSTMYLGWMVYAYLTAIPICLLASFTLILIFRWIHIVFALVILLAYISVMIMIALIMAMFHSRPWIACLWSVLFTLLNTFLAELLVHHNYDLYYEALTFLLHIILPPLGLVHALNQFALLQTGRGGLGDSKYSLFYTICSWTLMNMIYFAVLMLLQRTLGRSAIGGQVSWKSIIFKQLEDKDKLNQILNPSPKDLGKLQEVDDLVSKAISFRNVSKDVMSVTILRDISFDIYRGEFTMLFSERVQEKMLITIEDLLTGLTYQDEGMINVLGHISTKDTHYVAMPQMMGYCHRSSVLIDDLTVEEHIVFYIELCLWNEAKQYVEEYINIRSQRLKNECDLESIWREQIRNLGPYYRAQVCWAIALLLEPRVIFIPNFTDKPIFTRVIKDKIMQYKKHVTIVMMCFTSIQLQYADRLFIFDSKVLVFGGTPAYMFFKYGREYRVRMTFRHGTNAESDPISELLTRASAAGATVRAHLGSLLILRLPSSPTENVAALLKDLDDNAELYGITSLSISLPDSEEVSRRAIYESRAASHETSIFHRNLTKEALARIDAPIPWKRTQSICITGAHIKAIGWKFLSFYAYNKTLIIVTVVSAILAGIFLGISLSSILSHLDTDSVAETLINGKVLTVEAIQQSTTLVLRTDSTKDSRSLANAYVLSETKATKKEIADMEYTALSHTESLTEYLVTRAIDSPQQYVYMYAYGMDVTSDGRGNLVVQALYSPMHHDVAAAARSLARVFMALIRHYTGKLDASITVTDHPLALDLTAWMKYSSKPPLLIQFLLILTIAHITLVPSKEYGIIRHNQCHAMNFSPGRYWFCLAFCDLMLYWILVAVMTIAMGSVIHILIPLQHLSYKDLVIVPILLIIYGVSCVPQAYLFSLGHVPALNTMSFVIVNIVFGETTMIAKLFYGNTLNYALYFMRLSPQFNMAYAYVKIKKIFLYNSECVIFKHKNLCLTRTFHKCCDKCGILQKCFKTKQYFTWGEGILTEVVAMLGTAVFFMVLLMLWEHRIIQKVCRHIKTWIVVPSMPEESPMMEGAQREKLDVMEKLKQMKSKQNEKVVTFGEHLLAANVTRKTHGMFSLRNVCLGLGKGEVLALSGLKRHGRLELAEVLAGYKVPRSGQVYCMSQWHLQDQPHSYSRNISLCCEREPLPVWMKVCEALALLAVLRGVPKQHVRQEVTNYIDALELHELSNVRICNLLPNERARVHFAAAVIAAPPILILDEFTGYQKYSVRRSMYHILYTLKKRGHSIYISSSNVESHLPITNRLAILLDGSIFDIDHVDTLVERYSHRGCTVVVHLKDEVDVRHMFSRYFKFFVINDISEVLVNIQVYDVELSWSAIFAKMEQLKADNPQVYSYIVSAIPIDYIYNTILTTERGLRPTNDLISLFCLKSMFAQTPNRKPTREVMEKLKPYETKYEITKLKELPWSVIFQR